MSVDGLKLVAKSRGLRLIELYSDAAVFLKADGVSVVFEGNHAHLHAWLLNFERAID